MMARQCPAVVEPLGTGDLMPALLIGFSPHTHDSNNVASRIVASTAGFPSWLVQVDQQAGGMCMFYPSALGVLLRLSANSEHAIRDPTKLIAGFHCMAEDPQLDVLRREHRHLFPLCQTWGEAYSPAQLQHLHTAISPYFRLPYPKSGHEAFVEYEECEPLDYFAGWRVVEVADDVALIDCEQLTYGMLWRDGRRLDAAVLRDLLDIGKVITPECTLGLFLLWENCD
ncbi:MAG: hypothetical protein IPK82_08280 [Polyangiaceae bacterium]|nr:hypothetical protein [Polyangiaceae bacterium]